MIAETPCGALVIAETNGPDGRSAMIHVDTLRCEALQVGSVNRAPACSVIAGFDFELRTCFTSRRLEFGFSI